MNATSAVNDLTDHAYDQVQELTELHPHDRNAVLVVWLEHTEPRLQSPGQGRDDHVGPVRFEIVDGSAQRSDAVLQLLDQVLLMASLVGMGHHFLGRHPLIVRDVEEVADVAEQDVRALIDGQVFPKASRTMRAPRPTRQSPEARSLERHHGFVRVVSKDELHVGLCPPIEVRREREVRVSSQQHFLEAPAT